MMERGSNSWVTGSDWKSGSDTRCSSSHSISDLPKDILVKILVRMTVKRILVCKCVCKSWYDLISGPEFARLHFDQAEVCPLLPSSNSVYLVQQEIQNFEPKLGLCDRNHTTTDVNFRLDCIFRTPPFRVIIVDSCDGLLLLWFTNPLDNELLSVCNPITGELIHLPKGRKVSSQESLVQIVHGFGFSSTSNEYKVLRIIRSYSLTSRDTWLEVHVLGTESWKDMGLSTFPMYDSPTYVNGFLYWSHNYTSSRIVAFDVEKECFRSFSVKGVNHLELSERVSLGALGQELCVSGFLRSGDFHVWVMKDHRDEKKWSPVFCIDMPSCGRQLNGALRPVKYLNDGSMLMFQCYKKVLICIDLRKSEARYVKVRGIKSPFVRAMAYIPSFVSLKHALSNHKVNVEVLRDTQWFTELEGETRDVYIVEEDLCKVYSDSDSDSDSEGTGLELYQEEIESEDDDQKIESEDQDSEFDQYNSEGLHHEVDYGYGDEDFHYDDGDQDFNSDDK